MSTQKKPHHGEATRLTKAISRIAKLERELDVVSTNLQLLASDTGVGDGSEDESAPTLLERIENLETKSNRLVGKIEPSDPEKWPVEKLTSKDRAKLVHRLTEHGEALWECMDLPVLFDYLDEIVSAIKSKAEE